jgi:hypothetical protein
MEIASKQFYVVLGFLLTIGFGFWLSRRSKPYNVLLFNVHKLIALGTVVLIGLAVFKLFKLLDLPVGIILLLIIAALSIVALFATGAFMSADKGEYRLLKLVHNIAPFVLVFSIGSIVYWLPDF